LLGRFSRTHHLNRAQRTVATAWCRFARRSHNVCATLLDESRRGTMKISRAVRVAVVASTLLVTLLQPT
jgi:hypothetical protein